MVTERRVTSGRKTSMNPGKASLYISPFKVRPGELFVLLCRVSSREQSRNLRAQVVNLRREIEARGGKVAAVIKHRWSGRGPLWAGHLCAAAAVARTHCAILIAATTDRFIRHPSYRSNRRPYSQAQARKRDLQELRAHTGGVKLMTFLNPDASPGACRSLLTRWGQSLKGKGGRPRKLDRRPGWRKRRRRKLLQKVLALHWDGRGLSSRRIAKYVETKFGHSISHVTVQAWINAHRGRR